MSGKKPTRRCVIRRHELYSKDELIERLNCCEATYRKYRRAGLKTCRVGHAEFIHGESVIEFFKRHEK